MNYVGFLVILDLICIHLGHFLEFLVVYDYQRG